MDRRNKSGDDRDRIVVPGWLVNDLFLPTDSDSGAGALRLADCGENLGEPRRSSVEGLAASYTRKFNRPKLAVAFFIIADHSRPARQSAFDGQFGHARDEGSVLGIGGGRACEVA